MKILVTGGAGYIGSHTVIELLAEIMMWWFSITSIIPAKRLLSG